MDSRRWTELTAAFLSRLTEKHDVADAEFLVDGAGYPTAIARRYLSGQIDYTTQNYVEECVSDGGDAD